MLYALQDKFSSRINIYAWDSITQMETYGTRLEEVVEVVYLVERD
jgi:hypothetical protein